VRRWTGWPYIVKPLLYAGRETVAKVVVLQVDGEEDDLGHRPTEERLIATKPDGTAARSSA